MKPGLPGYDREGIESRPAAPANVGAVLTAVKRAGYDIWAHLGGATRPDSTSSLRDAGRMFPQVKPQTWILSRTDNRDIIVK